MTNFTTNQNSFTDALNLAYEYLQAATDAELYLADKRHVYDHAKQALALGEADAMMSLEDSKGTVRAKEAKVKLMTAGLSEGVRDAALEVRKAEAVSSVARREYTLTKASVDFYSNRKGCD